MNDKRIICKGCNWQASEPGKDLCHECIGSDHYVALCGYSVAIEGFEGPFTCRLPEYPEHTMHQTATYAFIKLDGDRFMVGQLMLVRGTEIESY